MSKLLKWGRRRDSIDKQENQLVFWQTVGMIKDNPTEGKKIGFVVYLLVKHTHTHLWISSSPFDKQEPVI